MYKIAFIISDSIKGRRRFHMTKEVSHSCRGKLRSKNIAYSKSHAVT